MTYEKNFLQLHNTKMKINVLVQSRLKLLSQFI
jgi:hypothetical protein